jgi:hypothetical protein
VTCMSLLSLHVCRGARNNAFASHLMSHAGNAASLTDWENNAYSKKTVVCGLRVHADSLLHLC